MNYVGYEDQWACILVEPLPSPVVLKDLFNLS